MSEIRIAHHDDLSDAEAYDCADELSDEDGCGNDYRNVNDLLGGLLLFQADDVEQMMYISQ